MEKTKLSSEPAGAMITLTCIASPTSISVGRRHRIISALIPRPFSHPREKGCSTREPV